MNMNAQAIESVGIKTCQLFHRKPMFPPTLCADDLQMKHEASRRLIKRWESATAKMEVREREKERERVRGRDGLCQL